MPDNKLVKAVLFVVLGSFFGALFGPILPAAGQSTSQPSPFFSVTPDDDYVEADSRLMEYLKRGMNVEISGRRNRPVE